MATKKTTTTKKATTSKKPATKATRVTKTTKPAAKRVTKAKTQPKPARALGLRRENEDFMTFRVNRETVYWLVLGAVVIVFTAWIMQLQSNIQELYDEIDANTASASVLDATIAAKKAEQ